MIKSKETKNKQSADPKNKSSHVNLQKGPKTRQTDTHDHGEYHEVEMIRKVMKQSGKQLISKPMLPHKTVSKEVSAFTLEEVDKVLQDKKVEKPIVEILLKKETKKKTTVVQPVPAEAKIHHRASLQEILGFDPKRHSGTSNNSYSLEKKIPEKYREYYHLLLELKNHVEEGLMLHTQETLKESSTDLAKLTMDSGSENFDKDMMLGLVSNEKEILDEINAAIERIFNGTYGICEITRAEIPKERLKAVPFTRYSKEGQIQIEQEKRLKAKQQEYRSLFSDEESGEEKVVVEAEGNYKEDEEEFLNG